MLYNVTKCKAYLLEPPFCGQFICDTGVTHKLITRIKLFTNLKNETGKAGSRRGSMAEENKGKEKEKRVGEGKRRRGGENDRST